MAPGGGLARMSGAVIRREESADVGPAVEIWRAANSARRGGRAVPPEHEERVRGYARKPDAFLLVADDGGNVVGMALGMQGLADDGAGPPVPGLLHVSLVFVAPDRWGEGIGGRIMDAVLAEGRARGYARARLWTHADNRRAQRLYDGRGLRRSGRQADDDLGERIEHYERAL